MRKVLSVVLTVVMLAALVTVFPVSAAVAAPALVITEVCADTTGLSGNGSDSADCFEFMEIYNTSASPIDLYQYSIVIGSQTAAKDPGANTYIANADPIQAKGPSEYNTTGSVSTANYSTNAFSYYPTNPETAVLQPGQTAVIWVVNYDSISEAQARGSALTLQDFMNYYCMNKYSAEALANILVLAVDGNGKASNSTATSAYTATGSVEGTFINAGVSTIAEDANGIGGRFNLYNSSIKAYGIVLTSTLENAVKSSGVITGLKFSSCVSYSYVNYNDSATTKNMMYDYTSVLGQPASGSLADVSCNFMYTASNAAKTYSDNTVAYANAKTSSLTKFGDWDCVHFATPGLLLSTFFSKANVSMVAPATTDLVYSRNNKTVGDYTTRVGYTAYLENFYGMADSTDSAAIIAALGWSQSLYLNNGGTIRFSIEDGQLIADNLDVDANSNGVLTDAGDIDSTDGIFTICPTSIMEKIALDDYVLEYQLTYLDAQENQRYAAVVYNFNDKCTYDIFILRVDGHANNQRRNEATYNTYDSKTSVYYAGNTDASSTLTSLLNKITYGAEKVYAPSSTDMATFTAEQKALYAPILGRTLNVKVVVDQVAGPQFYVNDILISAATTDTNGVAVSPNWGVQTNYGYFSLGLFVSQRVKVAIDNIKVTGYTEDYSEVVLVDQNTDANGNALVEPATGDATIYVAVAMAVSFISLATLVVVKRRKNEI